ncbi:uncharacterized protein LOC135846330 isoform X2 [Planococcus citri]|uniref:uncharacterized protein LOC135846330 isoform X2 n=1 Tax=Planococcus citri TaxID=170843 RepID=UPI0031F9F773
MDKVPNSDESSNLVLQNCRSLERFLDTIREPSPAEDEILEILKKNVQLFVAFIELETQSLINDIPSNQQQNHKNVEESQNKNKVQFSFSDSNLLRDEKSTENQALVNLPAPPWSNSKKSIFPSSSKSQPQEANANKPKTRIETMLGLDIFSLPFSKTKRKNEPSCKKNDAVTEPKTKTKNEPSCEENDAVAVHTSPLLKSLNQLQNHNNVEESQNKNKVAFSFSESNLLRDEKTTTKNLNQQQNHKNIVEESQNNNEVPYSLTESNLTSDEKTTDDSEKPSKCNSDLKVASKPADTIDRTLIKAPPPPWLVSSSNSEKSSSCSQPQAIEVVVNVMERKKQKPLPASDLPSLLSLQFTNSAEKTTEDGVKPWLISVVPSSSSNLEESTLSSSSCSQPKEANAKKPTLPASDKEANAKKSALPESDEKANDKKPTLPASDQKANAKEPTLPASNKKAKARKRKRPASNQKANAQIEIPSIPALMQNTSPEIPSIPALLQNTSPEIPSIPALLQNTGPEIPSIPALLRKAKAQAQLLPASIQIQKAKIPKLPVLMQTPTAKKLKLTPTNQIPFFPFQISGVHPTKGTQNYILARHKFGNGTDSKVVFVRATLLLGDGYVYGVGTYVSSSLSLDPLLYNSSLSIPQLSAAIRRFKQLPESVCISIGNIEAVHGFSIFAIRRQYLSLLQTLSSLGVRRLHVLPLVPVPKGSSINHLAVAEMIASDWSDPFGGLYIFERGIIPPGICASDLCQPIPKKTKKKASGPLITVWNTLADAIQIRLCSY